MKCNVVYCLCESYVLNIPRVRKPVFHFSRIVPYRPVALPILCDSIVISLALVLMKHCNTVRFATIRLKWKTALILRYSC